MGLCEHFRRDTKNWIAGNECQCVAVCSVLRDGWPIFHFICLINVSSFSLAKIYYVCIYNSTRADCGKLAVPFIPPVHVIMRHKTRKLLSRNTLRLECKPHIGETQATKCKPMRARRQSSLEKHIFLITIVHERAASEQSRPQQFCLCSWKYSLTFISLLSFVIGLPYFAQCRTSIASASIYSRLLVIPCCRFIRFLRVELVWVYPCYLLCSFPCAVAVHDIDANRIVLPMAVDSTYYKCNVMNGFFFVRLLVVPGSTAFGMLLHVSFSTRFACMPIKMQVCSSYALLTGDCLFPRPFICCAQYRVRFTFASRLGSPSYRIRHCSSSRALASATLLRIGWTEIEQQHNNYRKCQRQQHEPANDNALNTFVCSSLPKELPFYCPSNQFIIRFCILSCHIWPLCCSCCLHSARPWVLFVFAENEERWG